MQNGKSQVRLAACARVPGLPKGQTAAYDTSAWKKWFKGTTEKCNEAIEEQQDAEAERLAAEARRKEAEADAAAKRKLAELVSE